MSCSLTERVSLLIDGELAPDEENRVRKHLTECAACQQAQEDFLLLRVHIKSYETEPDAVAERQSLQSALASKKTRWWRRRVSLPAPAFALLVAAMVALATWGLLARAGVGRRGETGGQARSAPASSGAPSARQAVEDLSRFDRGARAVVYKSRRAQPGEIRQ
jgi:anti-sigma factor RsiW